MILDLILVAVCIFMCSALDRCRGSNKLNIVSNTFEAFLMGGFLAAIVIIASGTGADWWVIPAFGAGFALFERFGWGEPLNAVLYDREMIESQLERWQVGPLAKDPEMALVVRGAIWGIPALAMSFYIEQFLFIMISMAIAMPVAVIAARQIGQRRKVNDLWALQEKIRGGLCATLTYIFASVYVV